jgi:hypothetical protein
MVYFARWAFVFKVSIMKLVLSLTFFILCTQLLNELFYSDSSCHDVRNIARHGTHIASLDLEKSQEIRRHEMKVLSSTLSVINPYAKIGKPVNPKNRDVILDKVNLGPGNRTIVTENATQASPEQTKSYRGRRTGKPVGQQDRNSILDKVNLGPGIRHEDSNVTTQTLPEETQSYSGRRIIDTVVDEDKRNELLDGVNLGPGFRHEETSEAHQAAPEQTQTVGDIPDEQERNAILDRVNLGPTLDNSVEE